MSIFYYAAIGNLQKVKEKIIKGMDPNIHLGNENTALMWAGKNGHLDVIEFLLSGGANINTQNEYGDTALVWAANCDRRCVVRFLISKGAIVDFPNKRGNAFPRLSSNTFPLGITYLSRKYYREYLASLKGPLSLQYITLNLIEEKNISKDDLPDVLFVR